VTASKCSWEVGETSTSPSKFPLGEQTMAMQLDQLAARHVGPDLRMPLLVK
jgi:hypothetical protein